MTVISKEAKKELIDVIQKRYNQASKIEKGKILAEFVSVSGYHRKHAIRLLNPRLKGNLEVMIKSKRIYDEAVKETLIILWEAACHGSNQNQPLRVELKPATLR